MEPSIPAPPEGLRRALERTAGTVLAEHGGSADGPPSVRIDGDVVVVLMRPRIPASGPAVARIRDRAIRSSLLEAIEAEAGRDVIGVLGDLDDDTGLAVNVFVLAAAA